MIYQVKERKRSYGDTKDVKMSSLFRKLNNHNKVEGAIG